ncbi:hypothetical protein N7481_004616 [Penicillium waksmanii]|uniref:uncharacterized protein n=1 Tax=Penicillium waksmanii TaxID=69791 RepID=UPI002549B751|nr:uncharacterized protein N7481_004616 [Penicillium waksmanii]KAJ5989406.1 hypothetical protein N7481_004616 [Penicillium waksmanii]
MAFEREHGKKAGALRVRKTIVATAAVAPQTARPIETAIDELEIHGMTAIEARDVEKMTLKAPAETVLDDAPLEAHPEKIGATEIVTATAENAENDLQVPTRIADDTDTAAIDTAKTAIAIVSDPLEDTEVHGDAPDLHENHPVHHPRKYSDSGDGPPLPEKEKPNFKNTGRLAAESNMVQVEGGEGIVLKYHEPPEARKPPPKEPWRLYVFKGEDLLEMVELGERSCWLVGRERAIVDFPLDHPSCSKQHAALQFRYVEKRNEYGDRIGKVKPYIIDLESANGTSVNGDPAPAGRYVEVMDKDVLRFGLSSREYVMMLPS